MDAFYLSKSQYCLGIRCPKALWLLKNHPEAAASAGDTTALENGIAVGNLAKGLFGDYAEIPPDASKTVMTKYTEKLLAEGDPVICEASFIYKGLYCAVDLLRNLGNGRVEIYEVKAENAPKSSNYDDVTFQAYVLKACGYDVVSSSLVYLNKDYVRDGEIEPDRLFLIKDVTADVAAGLPAVAEKLKELERVLSSDSEPCPGICDCCSTDSCSFWQYCSAGLPEPNVFSLSGIGFSTGKKIALYKKGIVSFDDLFEVNNLPKRQQRQLDVHYRGEEINTKGIHETLDRLSYPLYFLDFETYSVPVPPYDGISPYMQVPFQYSLHFIEEKGGELKHTEFLASPGRDSRRELAEQLVRDIPMNVCTTAYHASFEKKVIGDLALVFPDLSEHLLNIQGHIEDLEVPFRQQYYITPAMEGKSSIKYVLPALYPDDPSLDYHNLEGVHKGTEANAAFLAMADMNEEEREIVRRQLLTYCGLDTYAMVKVWEKLADTIAHR